MVVDLLYNLAAVVLPYVVCVAAVLLIRWLVIHKSLLCGKTAGGVTHQGNAPLITTGLCLGIGIGGFINDIVLWQLLQWHQMLSSRIPPVTLAAVSFNMKWDGVAFLLNLALTVTGVALLFRACRRDAAMSSRVLVGSILGGWGLFTVVEGLIVHLLFGAHHVHSGPNELAWDLLYLMFGVALMLIGFAVVRGRRLLCSATC